MGTQVCRNNTLELSASESSSSQIPKNHIGLILNVSKETLNQLIKINGEKNFIENFFEKIEGNILALINGNQNIPYFVLNELFMAKINEYNHNNNKLYVFGTLIENYKQFEKNLLNAFISLSSSNFENQNFIGMIDSKIIFKNIEKLKLLYSGEFTSLFPQIYEDFENINNKSSLILSLDKILKDFEIIGNKSDIINKYIIIITDESQKNEIKKINTMEKLVNELKKYKIIVITLFISKKKNNKKEFYDKIPLNPNSNLKIIYNLTSIINYQEPISQYFINKGWRFPESGYGILLFETNIYDLTHFNTLAYDLNHINDELIKIKLRELNYNNLFHFKYRFTTKNQISLDSWSYAYSAAIFLSNKTIIGRDTESFETIRENLIKYAYYGDINKSMIDNNNSLSYIKSLNINIKKIDEKEAREEIMKGRYVVCEFILNNKQRKNFNDFFEKNKEGVLFKNIINNGCEANNKSKFFRYAVILTEINLLYIKFLNSWGPNWADRGSFRINDFDVLSTFEKDRKPLFLSFTPNVSTRIEKKYYQNYIKDINELLYYFDEMNILQIRDYLNSLFKFNFSCEMCKKKMVFDKMKIIMENGYHKMICGFCGKSSIVDGNLKEILILKKLLDDGNKDFDINFEQKYLIKIKKIILKEYLLDSIQNSDDNRSISSEIDKKKKFEFIFDNKVNCIICIKNLDKNIFIANTSKEIVMFELTNTYDISRINRKLNNDEINTLCDLKCFNFFVTGGKYLEIFQVNTKNFEINRKDKINFTNNDINKILLINGGNRRIKKRFIACAQNGYIYIYNVTNLVSESEIQISYNFKEKCHNSCINSILYIPDKDILVSGSNGDRSLKFWNIQSDGLEFLDGFTGENYMIYNDSIIFIGNHLLVGVENGIRVFEVDKNIKLKYFFENKEFGGVFSMKYLENNYFICGRNFGFCSICLLRENSIRKINVFRNYKSKNTNEIFDDKFDKSFIPYIYVDNTSGIILICSEDKSLKLYQYEMLKVKI